MSNALSVEVHSKLVPVQDNDWCRLFPESPDPVELVRLVEKSGFNGFVFHSLVVRLEDRPILVLPLFETRYHLTEALGGLAGKVGGVLDRWFPNLLQLRILGVGVVESEWGEIGVDVTMAPEVLREAWKMALESLDALADGLCAKLLVWVNFTLQSGRMIPVQEMMRGYAAMPGVPCQVVPIRHDHLESYLESLSKATRKDMRRKLREAEPVVILRPLDPRPWLDAIKVLYQRTFHAAEFTFGEHRRLYFESVMQDVPGAQYVLYLLDGQLVAFNLVIYREQVLVDKYFCMDSDCGRQYNLYFLSWMENIRYCMENHIPLYHAGPGAEDVKARLKAESIPSEILFKHRNPFIQGGLASLRRWGAYSPKIKIPRAKMGVGWL